MNFWTHHGWGRDNDFLFQRTLVQFRYCFKQSILHCLLYNACETCGLSQYFMCGVTWITFNRRYALVFIGNYSPSSTFLVFQIKISSCKSGETLPNSSLNYGTISINGTYLCAICSSFFMESKTSNDERAFPFSSINTFNR